MKIYVVARGEKIGFFYDWYKVQPLVSGYRGNKFKSFSDVDEAIDYFECHNRILIDEEKEMIRGTYNEKKPVEL